MDGHYSTFYDKEVSGTDDDSLYQSQLEEVVQYRIRVPDGHYNLQLGFAELELSEAGKRHFDLWVEDSLLFSKLDIIQDHGYAKMVQYDLKNIHVSDGILNLYFNNWVSHPVINNIVIEQIATDIENRKIVIPQKTSLKQNYPNPFNPETKIELILQNKSHVELDVFNILGKKVKSVFEGEKKSGQHEFKFSGHNLSSGVYFYRLNARSTTGVFTENKKMLIVK